MLNFGLSAGRPLVSLAEQNGGSAQMSINAVWVPILFAGSLPAFLYCIVLMVQKRTSSNFFHWISVPYLVFPLLMGLLWYGSIVLYGWATLKIGNLGAVVGWPLFMITITLGSALWGFVTGEWKGASRRASLFMLCSVSVLVVAIAVLGGVRMGS